MPETPVPHGRAPQSDFNSQYARLLEAAGCRTQVELAAVLDIKQSSISDAKRRKGVPSDWLIKLFEKKQINPDWIRCGTNAKYLAPVDCEQSGLHVVRITEVRPPQECTAQDLVNELVRRALQQPDIETLKKEVANSWLPVHEADGKS